VHVTTREGRRRRINQSNESRVTNFLFFWKKGSLAEFFGAPFAHVPQPKPYPYFAVYRPFKAFSIFIRSLRSRQCVCRFGILMGRSLFETRATYFTRLSTRQKVHQTADRWEGMQTRHGESLHRTDPSLSPFVAKERSLPLQKLCRLVCRRRMLGDSL
jgi:hypothetical protein